MEYYVDNIPVPSRTGNAIPTRNTGLYSIVELTENDGAESDIFLSVVARYSRLTTLSRNKANRRWNETRIRRNVWISLNSFAIKHVRHAEIFFVFPRERILLLLFFFCKVKSSFILPDFGLSQSMKNISTVVCRITRWMISIVFNTNETISKILNVSSGPCASDSNVLSYCF
mgnify:FL=1